MTETGDHETRKLQGRVRHLEEETAELRLSSLRAMDELRERLRFEMLLTDMSAALAGVPSTELDQKIEELLKAIVEFFGAGRAVVIQIDGQSGKARSTHAHSQSGIRPFNSAADLRSAFSFAAARILRGEVFKFSHPRELPEEAEALRRYYEREGIVSSIAVPLGVSGQVLGSLSISLFAREQPWSTPMVGRLRLLGGMLANAMTRARAEAALRESEANMRAVLAAIPDLVFYLSREGIHLSFHATNRGDLYVQPEQFIGKSVLDVLPAEVGESYVRQIEAALSADKAQTFEYTLDFPRLGARSYEATVVPSGANRVLVTVRETTARKQMELRLRQAEKMEAIGQLAGGVAHDFNNQLGVILGFTEILRAGLAPTEKAREYFEAITAAVGRSADLTSKLLTFARKVDSQQLPVDLHRLILETIAVLRRTVDKRVEVSHQLDASQSTVIGDASLLQNALLNLGLNARDAMPAGGDMAFRSHNASFARARQVGTGAELSPGDYVVVEIQDTGCGIAAEHLTRVFEPFFTTKEEGKGTGMGLAAVYGTIASHGGAIEVQSTVGRGALFSLFLPVVQAPALPSSSGEPPNAVRGRGRVLVIDDEEPVCRVASDMLTSLGYEPVVCRDGRRAVECLRVQEEPIELVILDVVMPGLGGMRAFEALRQEKPDIKVLVCSGLGIQGEVQAILDAGASGFLQKPFRRDDLARKVAAVLGGNRV